ncbi:MAG: rhamnogalacturonan lyase [Prevotella sp.]|nr:rhamnogalacturonan lyase [Prevotella sp.]
MRRFIITAAIGIATGGWAQAQSPTPVPEALHRCPVAVPATAGNFISWRLLATDDNAATTFQLLRNGVSLPTDGYATCFSDPTGKRTDSYQVVTLVNGIAVDTTAAVKPWADRFLKITLQRPAKGENGATYSPNDCSVGDIDGDGQYEIFVKWDPSNQKDNSQAGVTDNVFIDCYKIHYDGTTETVGGQSVSGRLLWRIDLGKNIRAGAHYTQFMVYDFDGDGRAELMCKTAPGSIDGKGSYVNQAATDDDIRSASNTAVYRNGDGKITGGQEYLTVFNGATGEALHTIFYNPNRDTNYGGAATGTFNWDDRSGRTDYASYGNRGERYLAAVAHLDGINRPASGIFSRGYYTFAYIWAVDFDGSRLHQKWLSAHATKNSYKLTTYDAEGNGTTQTLPGNTPTSGGGSGTMYGNGNHNLSVADVDGDGRDEIVWGAAALDHDGTLLYATGFGHGDALHLADHNPEHPGLEMFQVHEEKGTYAWDMHDAATGEVLLKGGPSGIDNGRGIAGNFDNSVHGSLFWSGDKVARSAITGEAISNNIGSNNFRIFWDGDLQEELLDGNKIDKWNGNGTSRLVTLSDLGPGNTCNGSKNTPNLSADILGDWREEVILHNGSDQIAIYSTTIPTTYRVPTLMHDHTYRMGICWQNTAYNQPPHLGYFLPDILPAILGNTTALKAIAGEESEWTFPTRNTASIAIDGYYLDGNHHEGLPEGISATFSADGSTLTLKGAFSQAGTYRFLITLTTARGDLSKTEISIVCRNADTGKQIPVRWDFTNWSPSTIANLKADAAASKTDGWSDVEKQADADAGGQPTATSKDNCFWASKTTQPDANGQLSANGQFIDELRGLRFHQPALAARNLAIAINYPSTDLGNYHGPAYLWLGGAEKDYFTIPDAVGGTEIRMGIESHKQTDARGVKLYINNGIGAQVQHGELLKGTNGQEVAVPTAYTEQTWLVPETADIVVFNTNGCHIYFIEAVQTESAYAASIDAHPSPLATHSPLLTSSHCYDLQGRHLTDGYRKGTLSKGLYIVDGRKVVIK